MERYPWFFPFEPLDRTFHWIQSLLMKLRFSLGNFSYKYIPPYVLTWVSITKYLGGKKECYWKLLDKVRVSKGPLSLLFHFVLYSWLGRSSAGIMGLDHFLIQHSYLDVFSIIYRIDILSTWRVAREIVPTQNKPRTTFATI